MTERHVNAAQHTIIFGLKLYRWVVSPAKALIFGPLAHCRFQPSCSDYALEAVARHGALGGSWLAVKRICRCHPWGGCGEDAVPAPLREGRFQEGL
jgi:putative membrane protein insertion efficiency factor